MDHPADIEKARSYLDIQFQRPGTRRVALGPFITISRECGAGGSSLAEELRRRLDRGLDVETPHWTVFNRNLVEKALEEQHLEPGLARYLPEDKVSEINASVGEILGLHPSIWTLVHDTNNLMRRLAGMGHVVLVGRGANFATSGLAHGLHLRLVGSPAQRAAHLAELRGLTREQALLHLRRTDAARRNYVKSFFQTDIDDPAVYDLVLNMDRLTITSAADTAMAVLHSRGELVPADTYSA